MESKQPIVFFDGNCGLCDHFVNFVLKQDKKEKFLFSPLQGLVAQEKLEPQYTTNLKTVVLLKDNQILTQSDAVIEIIKEFGGIWSLLRFAKIIPKPIRDFSYHLVSENRYSLFGKKEFVCRLPTSSERKRFLE